MSSIVVSSPYHQTRCYLHKRIKTSSKIPDKLLLKARDIGYVANKESGELIFMENAFVDFLMANMRIVYLNNIWVIYNYDCGVYEELTEHKLAVIIKFILDCVNPSKWSKTLQVSVIDAIRISSNRVETKGEAYSNLIAVNNGVLDLKTCEIVENNPNYYLTRYINIEYNPDSKCSKFDKFISETTKNKVAVAQVLQELLGYILIGNCNCDCFSIWYGRGANGKSLLAKVLTYILGSKNVSSVSLKSFDEAFGLSPLIGKLCNLSAENECNIVSSTETLKSITSGDMVTINVKYRSAIETTVTTKLIFLTNNLPSFRDVSKGLLRRIKIIPFENQLSPSDINPNLYDELIKESTGIFMWMVEGANRLINNNYVFTQSSEIDNCLNNYKETLNPVEMFIKDRLEVDDKSRISHASIRADYAEWLDKNCYSSNNTENPNRFWGIFRNAIMDIYGKPVKEAKSNIRYVVGFKFKEGEKGVKIKLQKRNKSKG